VVAGPEDVAQLYLLGRGAADLSVRRVRARRGDAVARSAAIEELALLVRSALRALADPDQGGEVERPPLSAAMDEEARRRHPPRGAPRAIGWHVTAGWQVAVDGQSPAGQNGLVVRAGVQWRRLLLEAGVLGGIPATLADADTAVSLSRHGASVSGGFLWRLSSRLSLVAGAEAGALWYLRETRALLPFVVAAPSRVLPALLLSPQGRLVVQPFRTGALSRVRLDLLVSADGVVGAPELDYQAPSGLLLRNRLWPVQPRVGLSLSFLGPGFYPGP
jgi:hypothetical protein